MTVGAIAAAAMLAPAALAAAAPGTHHAARHHRVAAFGTVVDWRAASHTATVARPSGQLYAIHSRTRVAVGSRVVIRHLTKLRNGTYAGVIVRIGRARNARIRGRVVAVFGNRGFAVGAVGTTFVVSAGHHGTARNAARNSTSLISPPVGATVVADVQFTGNDLSEIDVHDVCGCAVPGAVEIGGTLTAVDTTLHTIVITDEHDGNPVSYTVDMPTSMDLSTLAPGQELHVLATPNVDGTYTFAVVPTLLEIEGAITSIDPTANTITVTNTDGGVTMTFVVDIPSTMDIGGFKLGDEIQLEVIQNADGTYSVAQCSDNSDGKHADDQSGAQGQQGSSGFGLWSGNGSSDTVAHRA